MLELGITPAKGAKWDLERAQTYYIQQIALQLERLNKNHSTADRINERSRERNNVLENALELIRNKVEIIELFAGEEYMSMSQFVDRCRKTLNQHYYSRDLYKAINETGYLKAVPKASGYRVYLNTDY